MKLLLSVALASLAGGLAIGAQWWIAGPLENGWFCTGRLACWLWTKASFPAYAIAVTIADSPDPSSGFAPMAIGTFVQWFVVVLAVTQLPRLARA